MKNLKQWLGLCEHKWETDGKIESYGYPNNYMPSELNYILKCEKCGDVKIKNLI